MTHSGAERRRNARLAEFDRRASCDPQSVRKHSGVGRLIAIHPMSDEVELLASIGGTPAMCLKVDGYLHTGRDVYFVQIQTLAYVGERSAGVYARRSDAGVGYRDSYIVVVEDALVSSADVERALLVVRRLVDQRPLLGPHLQRLR
jgi:hypothetical protein